MGVRTGLRRLGVLSGKSESELLGALGRPHIVKTLSSGQRLLEWRSGRFHTQMIAVLFDRDRQFVEVVARYPRTRTSRGESASSTAVASLSVRSQLAELDLRDARVDVHRRHGLWARSPH